MSAEQIADDILNRMMEFRGGKDMLIAAVEAGIATASGGERGEADGALIPPADSSVNVEQIVADLMARGAEYTTARDMLVAAADAGIAARSAEAGVERERNDLLAAAFRQGVQALKGELGSYEYHSQSVGVFNPYAYREWDGGYGMTEWP